MNSIMILCTTHIAVDDVNYVVLVSFDSDSIAYAAEPVFASLSNLLGNYERLPSNIPPEIKVSQRDCNQLLYDHAV
jgi:hypothetical protein